MLRSAIKYYKNKERSGPAKNYRRENEVSCVDNCSLAFDARQQSLTKNLSRIEQKMIKKLLAPSKKKISEL
jgi:hypothetical protein